MKPRTNIIKKMSFSLLGVLFMGASALATPHAFPVPFVAKQHTNISFRDLPGAGTIKIFTITGEEVAHLNIAPGQGILTWNTTNTKGREVATGVYFYHIDANNEKTTGKLVVIR